MNNINKKFIPYLYLLPATLLVIIVSFFPLIFAIRQSFYQSEYLNLGTFIGFENYRTIFSTSEGLHSITVSLRHVFGTLLMAVPFAFLLAFILNEPLKGRAVFRSLLFIPWVISQLIAAFLWLWLLNAYYGPISYFLYSTFNIVLPNVTTTPSGALPTLIQVSSWRFYPIAMVFILASLQTVSTELIEAADIDGASGFQKFINITFPLIKNTVMVSVVLISLYTFNAATITLLLTGGGPGEATKTLALKAFEEGFRFWHLGFGSAVAVVIFLFNIIFSLFYLKLLKQDSYS